MVEIAGSTISFSNSARVQTVKIVDHGRELDPPKGVDIRRESKEGKREEELGDTLQERATRYPELTITLRYSAKLTEAWKMARATFCPIRGDVWHLTNRTTVNGCANGTYLN